MSLSYATQPEVLMKNLTCSFEFDHASFLSFCPRQKMNSLTSSITQFNGLEQTKVLLKFFEHKDEIDFFPEHHHP